MEKHQLLYDICYAKISQLVQEEFNRFNLFLAEENISNPTNIYRKNGKEMTVQQVNQLYEEWKISKQS